ncbi:MAG: M1 family peptidase, partial [Bacteroidota bacterium]
MIKHFTLIGLLFMCSISYAQDDQDNYIPDLFEQLGTALPTPNEYRTASGAPGPEYWQTRADYKMKLTLNDEEKKLYGDETITYYNESPDQLKYLWIQLDQNVRAKDADAHLIGKKKVGTNGVSTRQMSRIMPEFDGGFKIESVTNSTG